MKAQAVTVKLKKPHTHQGKDCKPGDEITVRQKQADWLIRIEAAEAVTEKKKEFNFKGGE